MEQLNQLVDPTTGLPLGEALWQQIALSLFGIATILIGVAGVWISKTLATHLPAWMNAFLDQKRKDDIHGAAVTIARRIILEGGDPRQNIGMGVDYMIESAKDAYNRILGNGRTPKEVREIFGNILVSKIPLVVTELNNSAIQPFLDIPVPQPEQPEAMQPAPPLPTGGSSEGT